MADYADLAVLLDVLEDFLHLIELVPQLGELHVDLPELHLGVLLGGDRHLRQAAVFLAGGQLGPCLAGDRKLLSPLVDRIPDQAADDQDDDDEGDGGWDVGAPSAPP